MRKNSPPFFLLIPIIFAVSVHGYAQLWSGIVNPTRAIDWSTAGIAGGIPSGAWTQVGATLSAGSGDQTSAIQAALNACGTNHYVLLAPGTFLLNGGLTVPSNCALRGSGANQTILNAKSSNANDIMLGTNWPTFSNTASITGGTAQGSTSITVASASGIGVGSYVVISQLNDGVVVNQNGSEGPCTWCDGGQTSDGSRVQGQISQVTSVSGATIGISPGLFVAYTRTPTAVPLSGMVQNAGVENLQIYTNDTHTSNPSNIEIESCAYCWVSGIESNYTDGDHIDIDFSYHFMITNSYFSGTWGNGPGQFDHGLAIRTKSTGGVIQNNIFERTGILEPQRGAAGNVLAFNYMTGMYSNSSPNFLSGNIETHGAHVQYNLLEGNVVSKIDFESIWGSNADNTLFRNWVTGADIACNPYNAMAPPRQTVVCTPMGEQGSAGVNGWWEIQFVTAVNSSFLSTYQNFVGDVIGSAAQAALNQYNNPSSPMGHTPTTNAPSVRSYDAVAYGFAFGFGEASDTGGVPIANGVGCDGSYSYPCESTLPASTAFYYQEFNNISGSSACSGSCGTSLPPSFYLSGKPSWWGSLPWPAIGPDITGGSGPGGHTSLTASNPAQNCYLNVMGGVVGGRSPLTFNPSDCYASSTSQIAPPTQLKAVVH